MGRVRDLVRLCKTASGTWGCQSFQAAVISSTARDSSGWTTVTARTSSPRDYFLTRPYGQFAIADPSNITTSVLLLAVGVAVSQLAARARIHHTARLAETAPGPDTVVDHVCRRLVGLLALRGRRFEYGTLIGHPPQLEEDGTISWGHRRWDADRDGLPDEEVELRVLHNGHFHGRFMLRPTPGAVPPLAARLVAVTLADQAGAAFETVGHASTADT